MLKTIWQSHSLINSKNYLKIIKYIKNSEDCNYINNSECLKLLLNIVVENNKINSIQEIEYLIKELNLLINHSINFEYSFFIAYDICQYAQGSNLLINIGRGISTSSIILYGLGVTKINPVEFGLTYFRFLDPFALDKKIQLDIDCCDLNKFQTYVKNKYKKYVIKEAIDTKWRFKQALRQVMLDKKMIDEKDYKDIHYYYEQYDKFVEDNDLKFEDMNHQHKLILKCMLDKSIIFNALFLRYPIYNEIYNLVDTHRSYSIHPSSFIFTEDKQLFNIKTINYEDAVLIQGSELNYIKINLLGMNVLNDINMKLQEYQLDMTTVLETVIKNRDSLSKELCEYSKSSDIFMFQNLKNSEQIMTSFNDLIHFIARDRDMVKKYEEYHIDIPDSFKKYTQQGHLIFQEDIIQILIDKNIQHPWHYAKKIIKLNYNGLSNLMPAEELDFLSKEGKFCFSKSHATAYTIISLLNFYLNKYFKDLD